MRRKDSIRVKFILLISYQLLIRPDYRNTYKTALLINLPIILYYIDTGNNPVSFSNIFITFKRFSKLPQML